MEELPLTVKIVGTVLCLGAVVLLAAYDRIFKMFRKSPRAAKVK